MLPTAVQVRDHRGLARAQQSEGERHIHLRKIQGARTRRTLQRDGP